MCQDGCAYLRTLPVNKKTIEGASEYIKTCNYYPKCLVLHVTGNSLVTKLAEECAVGLHDLVLLAQYRFPGTKVVISEPFLRKLRTVRETENYKNSVDRLNKIVSDLVPDEYLIHHPNLQNFSDSTYFEYDGVHLNDNEGVKEFVRDIKSTTNPLLGLTNYQDYNSYSQIHKPAYKFSWRPSETQSEKFKSDVLEFVSSFADRRRRFLSEHY